MLFALQHCKKHPSIFLFYFLTLSLLGGFFSLFLGNGNGRRRRVLSGHDGLGLRLQFVDVLLHVCREGLSTVHDCHLHDFISFRRVSLGYRPRFRWRIVASAMASFSERDPENIPGNWVRRRVLSGGVSTHFVRCLVC